MLSRCWKKRVTSAGIQDSVTTSSSVSRKPQAISSRASPTVHDRDVTSSKRSGCAASVLAVCTWTGVIDGPPPGEAAAVIEDSAGMSDPIATMRAVADRHLRAQTYAAELTSPQAAEFDLCHAAVTW
jgi:hypothetical protein